MLDLDCYKSSCMQVNPNLNLKVNQNLNLKVNPESCAIVIILLYKPLLNQQTIFLHYRN